MADKATDKIFSTIIDPRQEFAHQFPTAIKLGNQLNKLKRRRLLLLALKTSSTITSITLKVKNRWKDPPPQPPPQQRLRHPLEDVLEDQKQPLQRLLHL